MKGKKTGGRTKGSLNKISDDLRLSITEFLQNNFEEVVNTWHKSENSKEKLNFYKDLLKYAIPVLQTTTLETDFEKMTDEQLDYIINELKKQCNEQE